MASFVQQRPEDVFYLRRSSRQDHTLAHSVGVNADSAGRRQILGELHKMQFTSPRCTQHFSL